MDIAKTRLVKGDLNMKTGHFRSRVGGALLALSLLSGIYISTSVTAQAQWPYGQDDQYRRNRDYEREQKRRQKEIQRQQRREQRRAQRGGYYDGNGGYNNDGYYGVANNGARSGDGYGNYGGSFDLRQTALNAGANEGIKEGRRDRERGEQFNYADEGAYQNANKDYSSRLGDRNIFQQYFRQAFVTGYTEGYRGY
jgi:hypothetical protein